MNFKVYCLVYMNFTLQKASEDVAKEQFADNEFESRYMKYIQKVSCLWQDLNLDRVRMEKRTT